MYYVIDTDTDRTERRIREECLKLSLRKIRVANAHSYTVGKANVYVCVCVYIKHKKYVILYLLLFFKVRINKNVLSSVSALVQKKSITYIFFVIYLLLFLILFTYTFTYFETGFLM